eukprot:8149452-Pyramimonas_sp.AAC.1
MHWFRYEPKGDFNDQHNGFNDFLPAPKDEYGHQHNVVSIQWHSVTAFSAFVLCMSEAPDWLAQQELGGTPCRAALNAVFDFLTVCQCGNNAPASRCDHSGKTHLLNRLT